MNTNLEEMKYFFDKEKKVFLVQGIHTINHDCIRVSEEDFNKFINLRNQGHMLYVEGDTLKATEKPRPSLNHELINGKWEISEEKKTALLAENKKNLINRIANIVDEVKAKMLIGYSQAEIESFYKQEQEAIAYKADNTAQTPMLRQIAENRGVPFEILVQKVIEKSNLFAAAIGSVIGQRQRFEDRIEAVKTQEELDLIEKEIEQWTKSI